MLRSKFFLIESKDIVLNLTRTLTNLKIKELDPYLKLF